MNEHISRIAAEANFTNFTLSNSDAIIKFATLLIQEAARVADLNYDKGFCPVGSDIKEHFGVD